MKQLNLYILTVILFCSGIGLFCYKTFILKFPIWPNVTTPLWTVEAAVSFVSQDKPVKIGMFIPKSDKSTAVVDESFISPGFGLSTIQKRLNRHAEWSIRKTSGPQQLFYRAVIRKLEPEDNATPPPPTASQETDPIFEEADQAAAESLVEKIRSESADTESFVHTLLAKFTTLPVDENIRLLLGTKANDEQKILLASQLLNFAGIPSHPAHGLHLKEELRNAKIVHWLEVYEQGGWQIYDFNSSREPEDDYITWWRGTKPLSDITGGEHLKIRFSVGRSQEEAIDSALARAGLSNRSLLEYSMFSLPIQTQAVYRIILLVPIGALVIVLLRNIIGLRTFGTFMPVLIALAFRETELFAGVILFTLLVALGLAVRFYLEHLKLLLVPRLAAIVTIVVILMAAVSIIGHKLGIETGLSVALFPMVIMTMTIERMSIVWEEIGPGAALSQGAGTLFAAAFAYLILTDKSIEHLIFVFPELLLVALALILLLGRYTGYRLLELRRFGLIGQNKTD